MLIKKNSFGKWLLAVPTRGEHTYQWNSFVYLIYWVLFLFSFNLYSNLNNEIWVRATERRLSHVVWLSDWVEYAFSCS